MITVKNNYSQHCEQKQAEGLVIHYLNLNYTNEMEKAMMSAHGVCYEDYKRKLDVRLEVEKRREQDYLMSQRMVADMDRKVHS